MWPSHSQPPPAALNAAASSDAAASRPSGSTASHVLSLLPAKVLEAFAADGDTNSATADNASAPLRAPAIAPPMQARGNGDVVVDARQRVAVPAFTGSGLRTVVETAAGLGLRVEPVGSGIAREQAPAAGTMVPLGTEVVVRFTR